MIKIESNINSSLKPNDENIKKEELNIIYSDKIFNSKYYLNLVNIKNIITKNFSEYFLKKTFQNESADIQKRYLLINDFLIYSININQSNKVYNLFFNYLTRDILNLLEEKYTLNQYSLSIHSIFLLKLNENHDKNYSDKIIDNNKNSYEFLLLINLSNDNILIDINNNNMILENYGAIFFSSKLQYNIIDKKDCIIVVNLSYYGGYNKKSSYNKHPNQK